MNALTFEETNLLCIYNPGTRQGAIEALTEMRGHLQADEDELLALTDSTLAKLRAMTGWAPAYTFEQGLAATIEFLRGNLDRYKPDQYML